MRIFAAGHHSNSIIVSITLTRRSGWHPTKRQPPLLSLGPLPLSPQSASSSRIEFPGWTGRWCWSCGRRITDNYAVALSTLCEFSPGQRRIG